MKPGDAVAPMVLGGNLQSCIDWLQERFHGIDSPHPGWSPEFERLAKAFGLGPFEQSVLLACVAVELDGRFATEWGPITFSICLAKLPGAHWSAIVPEAPLRRWGLVEVEVGRSISQASLRVDESVLHALIGAPSLDARLVRWLEVVQGGAIAASTQESAVGRILTAWRKGTGLVQLVGADPEAAKAVGLEATRRAGLPCYRPTTSLEDARDREHFVWLWNRHALLVGGALWLDADDPASIRTAEVLVGPVLLQAHDRVPGLRTNSVVVDVDVPNTAERHELWQKHLSLDGADVAALAHEFRLGLSQIQEVAVEAQLSEAGLDSQSLWDAARRQTRGRLEELAERIETNAVWEDLVLPTEEANALADLLRHARHARTVYGEWGFAARHNRGLGIAALFSGPSGTGKTLAAEVVANALSMDLYRIDLSRVVSKYIGETEKNLRKIFDAAESGGVVLLFDEADALFGKRSDVKDSHDRYANIEVSYLLQRMEQFRGLAILTTNLKSAFDTAFLRRLRFVVTFPIPDAEHREQIWRRAFPLQTPLAHLDFHRLAQLNVSGGNIKNIALHAAFHAADEGVPVNMDHLQRAARTECEKLDRSLTDSEVRGWN
ncbi:MAG: ATP-binding protein [Fimbriimonas sp.]